MREGQVMLTVAKKTLLRVYQTVQKRLKNFKYREDCIVTHEDFELHLRPSKKHLLYTRNPLAPS